MDELHSKFVVAVQSLNTLQYVMWVHGCCLATNLEVMALKASQFGNLWLIIMFNSHAFLYDKPSLSMTCIITLAMLEKKWWNERLTPSIFSNSFMVLDDGPWIKLGPLGYFPVHLWSKWCILCVIVELLLIFLKIGLAWSDVLEQGASLVSRELFNNVIIGCRPWWHFL